MPTTENHYTQTDRDRSIEQGFQIKQIIKDQQEMKGIMSGSDHERRIRDNEKSINTNTEDLQLIKKIVYWGIGVILVTLLWLGLKLLLK